MTLRTTLPVLVAAACASAAGSTDVVSIGTSPALRTCGPVTAQLCGDLERQLSQGRQQVSEKSGGGKFTLRLPALGIGAGGSGQVASQSVALSAEQIDSLSRLLTTCSAAVRVPYASTIEAFWKKFGDAVDADLTCVSDPTSLVQPGPIVAPEPSPDALAERPASSPVSSSAEVTRSDSKGVLLDVDLGVPIGVHVGYDFGRHGVGVRAGVGPGIYSGSVYPAAVVGAFAAFGLDKQGRWRIEPTIGAGWGYGSLNSSTWGFLVGVDLRARFTTPEVRGVPAVGIRAGADMAYISSSAWIVPEGALVLSW